MKGLDFALLLTGCAILGGCASPAVTVANLTVNSGSFLATGKTISGHVISALSDMDCSLFRVFDNQSPCRETSPDGNVEIVYMVGGDAEAVAFSEPVKAPMAAAYAGPFRNSCLTRDQWRRAARTHSRRELRKLPPRCKPGQEWWHKVLISQEIEKPAGGPAAVSRQVVAAGSIVDDGEPEAPKPETPALADFGQERALETAGVETPALETASLEGAALETAALEEGPAAAALGEGAAGEEYSYRLGPGDKLRVTVYGEEDLSGEFEVGSAGEVSLPLIGAVRAADLTLRSFAFLAEARFSEGYLKHPRVSVEVLNYRPVYVLGEVNNPGVYEYVNHMTVLQAVVLAGGYSYRANEDKVKIVRRTHANGDQGKKAGNFTKVLPGDIVRIPERFF